MLSSMSNKNPNFLKIFFLQKNATDSCHFRKTQSLKMSEKNNSLIKSLLLLTFLPKCFGQIIRCNF